jgi:hypothetical protein
LAAIPHQELEGCFPGQEWVVLAEVADFQLRVPDDFPGVEFVIAEQALEQGGFARAVTADEADLGIAGQRAFRTVEEDLIAVAFVGVANL